MKKHLYITDYIVIIVSVLPTLYIFLAAHFHKILGADSNGWFTIFGYTYLFIIVASFLFPLLLWIHHKKKGAVIGTLLVGLLIFIDYILISTGDLPTYCSGGTCGYDDHYFILAILGALTIGVFVCEMVVSSMLVVRSELKKQNPSK